MKRIFLFGIAFASLWCTAYAGSLAPSATPAATGYTLGDIYARLIANTASTLGNHSLSTTTSPAPSFHTLTEIYSAIPTIDPATVISGQSYLGIAGTYSIANLIASNVKSGVTFGTSSVGSMSAGADLDASGPFVADGAADNGYLDQNTGLIWQHSAGVGKIICWDGNQGCGAFSGGVKSSDNTVLVGGAIEYCQYLDANGSTIDDTAQNIWHLPTMKELLSALDFSLSAVATALPNMSDNAYWSSTVNAGSSNTQAWYINFDQGNAEYTTKDGSFLARCVR